MENLNVSLLNSLLLFLKLQPISFIIEHSMLLGLLAGVLSLVPFLVARVIHLFVLLITIVAIIYVTGVTGLNITDMLYYANSMFIATLVGDYILGCVGGFVIANLIQRIRGEHDHVTSND